MRWIHIEDIFTIDAEFVLDMSMDSDKRRYEVSSFKDKYKALWDVKIKEDSAEIHPLWICHKYRKTFSL